MIPETGTVQSRNDTENRDFYRERGARDERGAEGMIEFLKSADVWRVRKMNADDAAPLLNQRCTVEEPDRASVLSAVVVFYGAE